MKILQVTFFSILFNLLLTLTVQSQNIEYEVDIDDLYSTECGDCYSGPDYHFFMKLYHNGSVATNWNPIYNDDSGCNWLGKNNFSYYDNTNAIASTYINLHFNAYEDDDWTCGGNDGDCGGYASANGNISLTALSANIFHYYIGSRVCNGVTWKVEYSYKWFYKPILTPNTPTSFGTDCSLILNATTSSQTAVEWYWQTSATGVDQTYAANNPPAVPNGTTTYYLRSFGQNTSQWGTASAGLTLSRNCFFWCVSQSLDPPSILKWTDISLGSGHQNSVNFSTSDFAANSLIVDVNTDAGNYGSLMDIDNSTTSNSLVNNNLHNWTTWDGSDPNVTWRLATDNSYSSSINPSVVTLEVCACKPATYGSINSSVGITTCPDEVFTLTHNGSISSRLDNNGYGEELRWFTGSCGGTLIGSGLSINVTGPGTETAVTYYTQFFTDGVACGACQSLVITYEDNIDPIVSCPAPQTDYLDGNCEWSVLSYIALTTFSDNCVDNANLTITQSPIAGSLVSSTPGTVENVTITVDDGYGNTNSCVLAVTMIDTISPIAICKPFTLQLNSLGLATLISSNVNDSSTDNCSSLTFGLSKTSFTCSDIGNNNVTLTVTDANGNTSTCISIVTVEDNVVPTAICQNYTVVLDASGNGVVTVSNINNGSNDACGLGSLSISPSSFNCSNIGANTVTLTVFDLNSNSSTCTSTVTVVEAVPTASSAGNDVFTCHGDNVTMSANTPAIGTGLWSWVGPGVVTYVTGTASTPNAEVSFSLDGEYTGTWTISSNCNSSTDDVLVSLNAPKIISTTAGANGQCSSNAFSGWIHIFDNNGNVIASVNDNGQSLGNVNVTIPTIGNASASFVCSNGNNAYMGRFYRFFSSSTAWYGNDIQVRLYFTAAELNSLIDESLTTAIAPNNDPNGCEDDDDVTSINDIVGTKYVTGSGPGGNGVFLSQLGNGFDIGFDAHYVDFNVNGFSDIYLHGSEHGVALPVELIDFDVVAINNAAVNINWSTATEINNEGFELQRSTDGKTYQNISWIQGQGNSNNINKYSYLDEDVSVGRYYYRLKQIDFDGQFEYSIVKSVELVEKGLITVGLFTPNPTDQKTHLVFNIKEDLNVSILLLNNIGKRVFSVEKHLSKGSNKIFIDTERITSGIYTAKITVGKESFIRRLLINHN